jgi:hypothetical protein
MSSPLITFNSRPDTKGQGTRLVIDPKAASIKSILLLKDGEPRPALNLQASVISLFTIHFIKFSLTDNKRLPETIEYQVKPGDKYNPAPGDASTRTLIYEVASSPEGFEPIKVTLTFSQAADPPDHEGESIDSGWIELDIQYTYPSEVSGDDKVAWETELIYPQISFNPTTVQDYLLLDPIGRVGDFAALASTDTSNMMPVQFAALYRLSRSSATGIALAATDEQGHAKNLLYHPVGTERALAFHLTLPIHLKTINSVKNYVRPSAYTLSGGAGDKGFSGAQMHYRIRAYQVEGAKNASVDWPDVVEIYRKWVKNRKPKPSFYSKKFRRPLESFGGSMSPLTVVANYGLDAHIDPGVVDQKLSKWLEVHPIVIDEQADMPGNDPQNPDRNESLQDFLVRIKKIFKVPGMKLEAQLWGFEMAGFYQFLGAFPPATNVITGKGRFQRALKALVSQGVMPSVTTDPLNTNFERHRFRGHFLKDGTGWREAIPHDFPTKIKEATCADPPHTKSGRKFKASVCSEAATLTASWKVNASGGHEGENEALTRFYKIHSRRICPTRAVEDLYHDTWLQENLLAWGVKLIEFMKHHPSRYFCYDKNHTHIDPPETELPYDNVIGRGPWYIKRLQQLLGGVQELGQQKIGDDFTLTNEFHFPETLVPYFDEFYEYENSSRNIYARDMRSLPLLPDKGAERRVPVFRFVYNELVSMKMNLAVAAPNIHPGYKEKRKGSRSMPPTYMLDAKRDEEDDAALKYGVWQRECFNYFNANYEIVSHGIAPKDYPTNSAPGTPPGTPPSTYTFNQCIQSVFNLRSHIFHYGIAAVLGERIYLFSELLQEPSDYNTEAINMAVRAAHMQMRFKGFFRGGYMLGQTQIVGGNKGVWAWRIHRRQFNDVEPLVNDLYDKDEIDGKPGPPGSPAAKPPIKLSIQDFISRAIDKQKLVPLGNYDYRRKPPSKPDENPPLATKIVTDKIQHMIWQRKQGETFKTLYTFANIGNSNQSVQFFYSRGLESAEKWTRTIYTFDGDPEGAPGRTQPVTPDNPETVTVPARSCVGILIVKSS